MTGRFTAACVQITGGQDPAANRAAAAALVREARSAGAELIATPEVSNMIGLRRSEMALLVRPEAEDFARKYWIGSSQRQVIPEGIL